MVNWCLILCLFSGDGDSLEGLHKMTLILIEREAVYKCGHLHYFNIEKLGYLFEVTFENNTLSYLTRWLPNSQVIIGVADYFGLSFVHWYDEQRMQIYGIDSYQAGQRIQVALEESDFSSYSYNEQCDCYWFEGES